MVRMGTRIYFVFLVDCIFMIYLELRVLFLWPVLFPECQSAAD